MWFRVRTGNKIFLRTKEKQERVWIWNGMLSTAPSPRNRKKHGKSSDSERGCCAPHQHRGTEKNREEFGLSTGCWASPRHRGTERNREDFGLGTGCWAPHRHRETEWNREEFGLGTGCWAPLRHRGTRKKQGRVRARNGMLRTAPTPRNRKKQGRVRTQYGMLSTAPTPRNRKKQGRVRTRNGMLSTAPSPRNRNEQREEFGLGTGCWAPLRHRGTRKKQGRVRARNGMLRTAPLPKNRNETGKSSDSERDAVHRTDTRGTERNREEFGLSTGCWAPHRHRGTERNREEFGLGTGCWAPHRHRGTEMNRKELSLETGCWAPHRHRGYRDEIEKSSDSERDAEHRTVTEEPKWNKERVLTLNGMLTTAPSPMYRNEQKRVRIRNVLLSTAPLPKNRKKQGSFRTRNVYADFPQRFLLTERNVGKVLVSDRDAERQHSSLVSSHSKWIGEFVLGTGCWAQLPSAQWHWRRTGMLSNALTPSETKVHTRIGRILVTRFWAPPHHLVFWQKQGKGRAQQRFADSTFRQRFLFIS